MAKLRKQRLLDALALYKLYNDADSVEAWLDEKVKLKMFSAMGFCMFGIFKG